MKWSQYGRITLALVASLALGLSITACNPSFTLGFVYALTAKGNLINAYMIDSVSGALTQLPNSPFPSGGQYPIAAAVTSTGKSLYVVHEADNSVVQFTIAVNGALQSEHTYNTPGTYPISVAMGTGGKFLFVVDSYGPGFNGVAPPNINPNGPPNTAPTQGCVVVYPISSADGSLGTPVSDPTTSQSCFPVGAAPVLGAQPISITATAFVNYLYVADQGTHTIYAYSVDYSTGILTPLSTNSFQAGVKPSAIASDATGRFVYVTDQYTNQLLAYNVQNDGTLQSQLNGPFTTDLYPNSLVIDPRGKFLYVTNYNSNDVRAYTIDPSTGNPTGVAASPNNPVGTGPNSITIEPAYGRYVFVSNFLDNTISTFKLDPHTGALTPGLNTPFPTAGQPTYVVAAANGAHPVQSITP